MSESKINKSTAYIGARIRDGIKLKNTTQKHVAKAVGITEASISNIINANQNPGLDTVEKIAEVLDIPMDYFFPPYSISKGETQRSKLLASVIDDIMVLSLESLKALKVITDAMRFRVAGK